MLAIPKIIHQVWIGPKTAPQQWMDTWKQHHPSWDYILWDNEAVFGRSWFNQRLVDDYRKMSEWRGVADVVRYEILYQMGGFMPGADSECLRPCDELFATEHSDFAVYENERVRPGLITPLYAARQGSVFSYTLTCSLLYQAAGEPWKYTGNLHMRRVYEERTWNSVKIWPSHYFNPSHYTGDVYQGTDQPYAKQHWGSTNKLYK